jgi:hypothetical protein
VDLPICRGVADLVCGRRVVAEVIAGVLSRPTRNE